MEQSYFSTYRHSDLLEQLLLDSRGKQLPDLDKGAYHVADDVLAVEGFLADVVGELRDQ